MLIARLLRYKRGASAMLSSALTPARLPLRCQMLPDERYVAVAFARLPAYAPEAVSHVLRRRHCCCRHFDYFFEILKRFFTPRFAAGEPRLFAERQRLLRCCCRLLPPMPLLTLPCRQSSSAAKQKTVRGVRARTIKRKTSSACSARREAAASAVRATIIIFFDSAA